MQLLLVLLIHPYTSISFYWCIYIWGNVWRAACPICHYAQCNACTMCVHTCRNALTMATTSPPGVMPFIVTFGYNNFAHSGNKRTATCKLCGTRINDAGSTTWNLIVPKCWKTELWNCVHFQYICFPHTLNTETCNALWVWALQPVNNTEKHHVSFGADTKMLKNTEIKTELLLCVSLDCIAVDPIR